MKKSITGLCKLFVLVTIAISLFSSCKKIQDPDSDPTSPDSSGDISSFFSPGALSARPGQLDSIGYIEDLDTALISPFARINAPSSYNIAMPVPGHQSNYGTTPKNSCVGWVVGYGLMSYIYTKIKGNFTGSPSFVWNQLNGGKDDAVSLADALTGVKENGCCSTAFMGPFVPVNEQPSVLAKESAKHQTIAEFYAMRTMDLAVIKNYLTYGVPMPFLATIDRGFLNEESVSYIKDNDGAYIYKKNSGVVEGKHAMLLVGYDDTKHAFKIMNSRGPGWANGGFAWIDYDMFKTMAATSGGLLNGGMRYNIFWVVPQVVETGLTTAVKATSVLAEGLLLNNAGKIISERGFCWSDVTKFPKALNSHIVNNSGLTIFKSTVIGLMPETKYYLRAYAKMSSGSYHYGEVDSFTTNRLLLMEEPEKIATTSQTFNKQTPRNFYFKNFDLSPAPGIDYSLVTTANNSNNQVAISRSSTIDNFNLTLTSNQPGGLTTSFDILYRGKKVETINASVIDIDSTEIYKAHLAGNWKVVIRDNNDVLIYTDYVTINSGYWVYQREDPNGVITVFDPLNGPHPWNVTGNAVNGYRFNTYTQISGRLSYPVNQMLAVSNIFKHYFTRL